MTDGQRALGRPSFNEVAVPAPASEQTKILDLGERDREWLDSDGIRWRWSGDVQLGDRRGGWQFLNTSDNQWVTSIRPRIMGRSPYTSVGTET